jgi:hypothetical protein
MESKKAIICWVHGEKSSFQVDIDPENSISNLKKAIAGENPHTFGAIDPRLLELYVANIDETEEAMESFSFGVLKVLPGSRKISKVIKDELLDKDIYFVIKPPGKQHSFILSTYIC